MNINTRAISPPNIKEITSPVVELAILSLLGLTVKDRTNSLCEITLSDFTKTNLTELKTFKIRESYKGASAIGAYAIAKKFPIKLVNNVSFNSNLFFEPILVFMPKDAELILHSTWNKPPEEKINVKKHIYEIKCPKYSKETFFPYLIFIRSTNSFYSAERELQREAVRVSFSSPSGNQMFGIDSVSSCGEKFIAENEKLKLKKLDLNLKIIFDFVIKGDREFDETGKRIINYLPSGRVSKVIDKFVYCKKLKKPLPLKDLKLFSEIYQMLHNAALMEKELITDGIIIPENYDQLVVFNNLEMEMLEGKGNCFSSCSSKTVREMLVNELSKYLDIQRNWKAVLENFEQIKNMQESNIFVDDSDLGLNALLEMIIKSLEETVEQKIVALDKFYELFKDIYLQAKAHRFFEFEDEEG